MRRRTATAVAHAAQQLAVGDAGGDEEAVVAGDQVVGAQEVVRVQAVAGIERLLALLVVLRPEPAWITPPSDFMAQAAMILRVPPIPRSRSIPVSAGRP